MIQAEYPYHTRHASTANIVVVPGWNVMAGELCKTGVRPGIALFPEKLPGSKGVIIHMLMRFAFTDSEVSVSTVVFVQVIEMVVWLS